MEKKVTIKKTHQLIISLLLVSIIISSCSISDMNDSYALENGTLLSSSEVEALNALEPQANAIRDKIIVENTRSIESNNDNDLDAPQVAIVEAWIDLLKENFGDDYLKYIVRGTYGEETVIISEDSNARISVPIGEDSIFTYQMTAYCKWISLPWGAYNYADTYSEKTSKITGERDTHPSQTIKVTVSDAAGTVSKALNSRSHVQVAGKLRTGFFPISYDPTSIHQIWDEHITNNYIARTYHWTH